MKKVLTAALVFTVLLCVAFSSLAADRFVFSEKSVTVFEGESVQVDLDRDGRYAEGNDLRYSTNKSKVVSVASDGTITGLTKGEAVVTCTLRTKSGATKKCTLTVKVARKVESVALNTEALGVFDPADETVSDLLECETEYPVLVVPIGSTVTLKTEVLPSDASSSKVSYEPENPTIAEVVSTKNGMQLKGTKLGECDFTVASVQNPEVVDMYHLLVVQPVSGITIEADSKSVNVGSTLQLSASFKPSDAPIQAAIWSVSSGSAYAEVDEFGTVTGLKRGSATIKAISADGSGKSATISLKVVQGVESVTVKQKEATMNVGSSKTVTAVVAPSTAANRTVTWTSSDPSVATVTKAGQIKAVSVGDCELYCTSNADESIFDTMELHVQQPVTRITFSDSSFNLNVGTSEQLNWEVYPDNATNPSVTFKSGNERIAKVDQNGVVTGIKRGSCKITATAADGSNRSASITVKVIQPVEGVYFRQDIYHVPYHGKMTLHSHTTPNDADIQSMSWDTDDYYVCTVSSSHTKNNAISLYGEGLGSTTLYVTTDDGGYTATALAVVDHYHDPVIVNDLYLDSQNIRLTLRNQTSMNLTKVYFKLDVYDKNGFPLPCNSKDPESHTVTGYYLDPLEPGEYTSRNRFRFENYVKPSKKIGGLILTITGFQSDDPYIIDGTTKYYGLTIPEANRTEARYPSNFKPTIIYTEKEGTENK